MERTVQPSILLVATLIGVSIYFICNDPSIDRADTESFPAISLNYIETSIPSSEYSGKNPFPLQQQQKESISLSSTIFNSPCLNLCPIGMRGRSRTYQGRAPPKIIPLRFEAANSLQKHFCTDLLPRKNDSSGYNDQGTQSLTLLRSPSLLIRRVNNLVSLKFPYRWEALFHGHLWTGNRSKTPGKGGTQCTSQTPYARDRYFSTA